MSVGAGLRAATSAAFNVGVTTTSRRPWYASCCRTERSAVVLPAPAAPSTTTRGASLVRAPTASCVDGLFLMRVEAVGTSQTGGVIGASGDPGDEVTLDGQDPQAR